MEKFKYSDLKNQESVIHDLERTNRAIDEFRQDEAQLRKEDQKFYNNTFKNNPDTDPLKLFRVTEQQRKKIDDVIKLGEKAIKTDILNAFSVLDPRLLVILLNKSKNYIIDGNPNSTRNGLYAKSPQYGNSYPINYDYKDKKLKLYEGYDPSDYNETRKIQDTLKYLRMDNPYFIYNMQDGIKGVLSDIKTDNRLNEISNAKLFKLAHKLMERDELFGTYPILAPSKSKTIQNLKDYYASQYNDELYKQLEEDLDSLDD